MAKKKKPPKLNGRPTTYQACHAEMAYKLCLLGATNEKLAEFFNVNVITVRDWKKKHPKFATAIKKGKDIADAEVAEALFNRAKGYSHPDVHISNFQGHITITDITKHYPPDTAAAFIWLKNRAGWKDKTEHILEDQRMSKEEIEAVRNHLASQLIK